MSNVTIIKKYPNRRLYDTSTSTYITLNDIKEMVLRSEEFNVIDAKTNEDLTRQTLMQIMLEEEAQGMPLFSVSMLSRMIKMYGQTQQSTFGPFFENSLQQFLKTQEVIEQQMKKMSSSGFDSKKSEANIWKSGVEQNSKIWQELFDQQKKTGDAFLEQMQRFFKK